MIGVRLWAVTLGVAVVATTGCGVFKSSTSQASSESSSDSSKGSSDSSSSSSGSDESKLAYQRDVRDVTARYASAPQGGVDGLERDLGGIAARHGIVDWEQDRETYVGIGQGLARAGLAGRRLQTLTASLAHDDVEHARWIYAGYGHVAAP